MKLKTPELVWLNPKAPYSQEYTDRYYSEGSPEDECRHVYLAANGLPDRWIHRLLHQTNVPRTQFCVPRHVSKTMGPKLNSVQELNSVYQEMQAKECAQKSILCTQD